MNKQLTNNIYILICQVTNSRNINTQKKKKKKKKLQKLEPGLRGTYCSALHHRLTAQSESPNSMLQLFSCPLTLNEIKCLLNFGFSVFLGDQH